MSIDHSYKIKAELVVEEVLKDNKAPMAERIAAAAAVLQVECLKEIAEKIEAKNGSQ